jgi:hypothetical protein
MLRNRDNLSEPLAAVRLDERLAQRTARDGEPA